MKIYELSANAILKKIKDKEISVRTVIEAFLDRIQEVNPLINAIHQVDHVRLLQEADRADLMIAEGKPLGKLHGLPITIKDTCLIAGFKVGKGYPAFFKQAEKDATIISRLREAGAIILGVTNVPELLLAYETDNRANGRTNNPYDLSRTPGGSSGGEAALISAGGSIVGIGSDAGGSIRQPAHYCGICAHKPTQGLIPLTGDVPFDGEAGLATSLLTMGPMARYVEDLILLLEIIAGPDGNDPYTPALPMSKTVETKTLRVAYYFENADSPPTEEVVNAVKKAIQALQPEVANIVHDYPKLLDKAYRLHWETFILAGDKGQGMKSFFAEVKDDNPTLLLKQFLAQAESCEFSLVEFRQRMTEVERFRYDMMDWMSKYDVIISPVASTPARSHGKTFEHVYDFNYVRTHNLSLWPATVIPVCYSSDGLPIGIQIASKPWHDHLCLHVAKVLQNKLGVFPIPQIKQTSTPTITSKL
jgi:amidase